MSDGLNKLFMKSPAKFMREYPTDISPYTATMKVETLTKLPKEGGLASGMAEFDLWKNTAKGLVCLGLAAERVQTGKVDPPIPAYWLAWNPKDEANVTFAELNESGASFLFTSSLAGCRILITETTFYHISGNLSQSGREKLTQKITGGGRARAFSASTGNTYGDDGAFIVGYRSTKGLFGERKGGWKFFAQQVAWPNNSELATVGRKWENNELYLIGQS